MRLKLFSSSLRHFATRSDNPLFLQPGFSATERKSELMLDIKQLELFPKIVKNYSERDINYHEAIVNSCKAREFKPATILTSSSITPYTFYGLMAMNCFRGYWYDSLIDSEVAENILNQNRTKAISLNSIIDIRNQLGVSPLLPPLEEIFASLQQIPIISYDSSQKLIIAVNYTQSVKNSTELKSLSIPLLNIRSRLILQLAGYFTDIFNLLGKNWLLTNRQYRTFSMFSPDIVDEKAKLQGGILKLSGELIKQNAELMLMAAKLLQLMRRDEQDGPDKFSTNELLDIMASWSIPVIQLKSPQIRKTDNSDQDKNHDVEKNSNKKFPNFVDTKKMEQALEEAAKNGSYY